MTDSTLQISLNGNAQCVAAETTVAQIIAATLPSAQGCAVAINGDVIPKSTWDNVIIRRDDRIEILTAAPGG